MATYPIRQLADNGGTAQFVPVTAPEAVQFPDGSNLNTFIGSVATIESNPVAANHAVGEFLCVNGQVYEVIDAITAGDSIALGENVQVANLGSQITALNNGLMSVGFSSPEIVTFPFTADRSGMLLVQAGAVSSSTGAYIYITDRTLNSQVVTAYNLGGVPINQYYPCVKGHTYAVTYQSNVNNIVHRFFAMGN